jgi:ATP-dependent RNA helicase DeaD
MSEISETNVSETTDEVFTTVIETVEEPEVPSGFSEFGFSEALLKTLADKGYKEPSPIQKAAIPELMLGRDLVGQAQTGTGKNSRFRPALAGEIARRQPTSKCACAGADP